MSFNLDSLFVEWRSKVPTGIPNPKNAYHLVLLKEICLNRGIDVKIVDDVILTLEQDDKKVDPETIVKFKDKDGENKEMEYQNAIRQPEDTPARDAAEKLKKSGGEDDKPSGSQLGPSDFDSTDYMKSEPDAEDVGKKDDGDDSDDETQSQEEPDSKEELLNKDHETTDKQLNMTKTEAKAQAKSKDKKDVGAGTPESRAGEAMVHKGLRLLKDNQSIEEIESTFRDLVNQKDHVLNSKEGKKWVDATISTIKKLNEVPPQPPNHDWKPFNFI